MSRIGKIPVDIPNGVNVKISSDTFTVEGPKGSLSQVYTDDVEIKIEGALATVTRKDDTKKSKALHGLYRNLLNNMVIGVSKGFQKVLMINGVGYRAEVKGKTLTLNLGYSNPIEYPVPDGLTIATEGNNKIVVSGISKERVGQVSSEIRSLRPPEPYKGKGIKYDTEVIRRKVGKSGVK